MYQELEAFKVRVANLETKIASLKGEKLDCEEQINQLEAEIGQALLDNALDGTAWDENRIKNLKEQKAGLQDKINLLEERISVFENNRKEALLPYVGELEVGYRREMEQLRAQFTELDKDTSKKVAEYFLHLASMNKVLKQAQDLHSDFLQQSGMATDKHKDSKMSFPRVELFNDYTGVGKGIGRKEQEQALAYGYIPHFVKLYEMSGEIVLNKNEAAARIRELERQEA
ncbi:hypothetical protein [Sutcliffiella horikoshii]|uniref:hypothetical protein n=1 Tax=Sutcliffiella horikoshii TaxID=79883 RepID=UPI00384E0C11